MKQIGGRFYFSFSWAVHQRMDRQRVMDVMKHVPDDRLLMESDLGETDIEAYEDAMMRIATLIGEAKGWSLEDVYDRTQRNFGSFVESLHE
jgi:Tat protein secretion system quality control protein TatD with DNase activity